MIRRTIRGAAATLLALAALTLAGQVGTTAELADSGWGTPPVTATPDPAPSTPISTNDSGWG
ncbi:hypothetical protein [Streptomyces sp. NPDC048551]|uniref:hypothetical protein n=1 Tax=Streptomyces sp. NPDC048551 TaxID=3155758 RepID=UPI00342465EA